MAKQAALIKCYTNWEFQGLDESYLGPRLYNDFHVLKINYGTLHVKNDHALLIVGQWDCNKHH